MRHAFNQVTALAPASDTALLIVGERLHPSGRQQRRTPASKHKLDVDGASTRCWTGRSVSSSNGRHTAQAPPQINSSYASRKSLTPMPTLIITFRPLRAGTTNEPRITVEEGSRAISSRMQWGRSAIFATGDKAKAAADGALSRDVMPVLVETKHQHLFTSHVHHDQAGRRSTALQPSCLLSPMLTPRRWATAGAGLTCRRSRGHKQNGRIAGRSASQRAS